MLTTHRGTLDIYFVNVGQGDTTVIVSPDGRITVIDARYSGKLRRLLRDLNLPANGVIEHLVLTHAHSDHYSAASSLARDYRVDTATLSPYWTDTGGGSPTYVAAVNRLHQRGA